MKPYPLSALNHLTVPVAIDETPPLLLRNGQRKRTVRIRYSLDWPQGSNALSREGVGDPSQAALANGDDVETDLEPVEVRPAREPRLGGTSDAPLLLRADHLG